MSSRKRPQVIESEEDDEPLRPRKSQNLIESDDEEEFLPLARRKKNAQPVEPEGEDRPSPETSEKVLTPGQKARKKYL